MIVILYLNNSYKDTSLLTQAYKVNGEQISIIPKSMEKYVSVQVVCLRFLDSHRFLSSGLDKLVRSINSFSIMDSNNFEDEFFKKLAYPYEYLNLSNFQESLNLTKKDLWPTLRQSYPLDEEISPTQIIIIYLVNQ